MAELVYRVTKEQEGCTLKTFLRNHSISAGFLRRLKATQGILVNGNPVTVRYVLQENDCILLRLPNRRSPALTPTSMELDILYEDDHILAVNKPSGMPVHPSPGHYGDTLCNGVAHYLGETATLHPVIRLDKYTSGIVLFAKNPLGAATLSESLQKGLFHKTYYAVVVGIPNPPEGKIDAPIGREPGSVLKRRVSENGKPAVTEYEVIERQKGTTLVKLHPITGRTHQIRVHTAHIGCPLLYDHLYGSEVPGKHFLLCCAGLTFPHPATGENIVVKAPFSIDTFWQI